MELRQHKKRRSIAELVVRRATNTDEGEVRRATDADGGEGLETLLLFVQVKRSFTLPTYTVYTSLVPISYIVKY
jgi:hypothetical protein